MNKNKIAIVADSSCDLSDETLTRYNIKMIPLRICFSDRVYRDRIDLLPSDIYPMLEKEIPKSSLPSLEDIKSILDQVKEEGFTDVLYIGLSTGLSGSYNFVKMVGEEYEGLNFHCVDTKTLSMGQGLLVLQAAKAIESGQDIPNTIKLINSIREKMQAFFVVKDLTYLSKGGRIGKVAGTVGSLLHLCPVVTVTPEGIYDTAAKTMGFNKAVDLMRREVEKRFANSKLVVSIVHGMNEEGAKALLDKVKSFANVVESSISSVTAVLGVHTGPGLLGIIAYEL